MIAWTTETEAIGYATSRLLDATDQLAGTPPARTGMTEAVQAVLDALAALVLVDHTRKGDALVSIDQLAADHVGLGAAQPPRSCCQTYPAEAHAPGCGATTATARLGWTVAQRLAFQVGAQAARTQL